VLGQTVGRGTSGVYNVGISSPECRSKSGHKNRAQIVQKCGTVQIFRSDSNKSKFDSGGN
jgi:hypothetical protein